MNVVNIDRRLLRWWLSLPQYQMVENESMRILSMKVDCVCLISLKLTPMIKKVPSKLGNKNY